MRNAIAGVGCALALLSAGAPAAGETQRGHGTYYLEPNDVVLLLGDAITVDAGHWRLVCDEIRAQYPQLLTEDGAPAGEGAGVRVRVVNAGVSGGTARDGLARLPGLLSRHKPTVAVVCFGTNDCVKDRGSYAANMRAIVRKLKSHSVAVTVLTPPCFHTVRRPELRPYADALGRMVDEARTIASQEGAVFADSYGPTKTRAVEDDEDHTWGDGVHPNDKGRRMLADALQTAWGFGKALADPSKRREAPPRPEPPRVVAKTTSRVHLRPEAATVGADGRRILWRQNFDDGKTTGWPKAEAVSSPRVGESGFALKLEGASAGFHASLLKVFAHYAMRYDDRQRYPDGLFVYRPGMSLRFRLYVIGTETVQIYFERFARGGLRLSGLEERTWQLHDVSLDGHRGRDGNPLPEGETIKVVTFRAGKPGQGVQLFLDDFEVTMP